MSGSPPGSELPSRPSPAPASPASLPPVACAPAWGARRRGHGRARGLAAGASARTHRRWRAGGQSAASSSATTRPARPPRLGALSRRACVEKACASAGTTRSTWIASIAAAVVAQQAAPGVELEQALAHPPVLGSSPSSASARAASASERIPNTNVAPIRFSSDSRSPSEGVADELRADDRHRQLGAPHPLQRGEQRAPDRVAEQPPALVEGEQLQPRRARRPSDASRTSRSAARSARRHAPRASTRQRGVPAAGAGRSRIGR